MDIIVRTYDSWTLSPVANYKRAGGSTSIKAGLGEDNILGSGKAASVVYNRDWGAESRSFSYNDLQFLNYKHLQYSMSGLAGPDTQNFSLSLGRPFYASIAPSAAKCFMTTATSGPA